MSTGPVIERVSVYMLAGSIKNMPRTGWLQSGVPGSLAETVASHMLEAALLCLDIGDRLSREGIVSREVVERASLLTIVHDLPEGALGDLNRLASVYIGGLKRDMERSVVERIGNDLVRGYFEEYLSGDTVASRLAHLCDRLATLSQALRYRRLGYPVEKIIETSIVEIDQYIRDICGSSNKCLSVVKSYLDEIEKSLSQTQPRDP